MLMIGVLISMLVFVPLFADSLEVRELPASSPEFSGSLGFDFSTADSISIIDNSEPIFGGFIQNRKKDTKLALKCIRDDTGKCTGYQFYLIPKSATNPADYINLNPAVTFTQDDLAKIEALAGKRIKNRVNPKGFTPPLLGVTFAVWMLAQQNRDHGKKLPVEILYIVSIPVDAVMFFPILIGYTAVWGTKQISIGIQQKNMKKAMAALEQQDKIRKISDKNFEVLVDLIRGYLPGITIDSNP